MKTAQEIIKDAFFEASETPGTNQWAYALGVLEAKYDSLLWDYQELKSKLEKKQ